MASTSASSTRRCRNNPNIRVLAMTLSAMAGPAPPGCVLAPTKATVLTEKASNGVKRVNPEPFLKATLWGARRTLTYAKQRAPPQHSEGHRLDAYRLL